MSWKKDWVSWNMKRMDSVVRYLLCIAVFLSVVAAGGSAFAEESEETAVFAVAEVESRVKITNFDGEAVNTHAIVYEYLNTYMTDDARVVLVDISDEVKLFGANELAIVREEDAARYEKLLRECEIDYLVACTLTNLSVKGTESGLLFVVDGRSKEVEVDLSIVIYEVKSGRKVCIVSGKGESSAAKLSLALGGQMLRIGGRYIPEMNLHNAIEKAVLMATDKIFQAM